MKKLLGCFLCLILLVFSGAIAGAELLDISGARGDIDYAYNSYGTSSFQTAPDLITYPSSGTGVFQPYLSIQKTGLEEGMGTDAIGQFDNKRMGNPSATDGWTHSITVGDLYQSSAGMYEFLIDLNEPHNANSKITLNQIEIYIASSVCGACSAEMWGYGTASDWSGGTLGTLVYRLDDPDSMGIQDYNVLMDYSLWHGQGQNVDTLVNVPMSLGGFNPDDYVYTYWQFGDADGIVGGVPSNSGFEEIIVRYQSVPEPATIFLLGAGLVGLAGFGRKRFKK
jgi:hypothetical protein